MFRKAILSLVAATCFVVTSTSWAAAPPAATTEPVVSVQPEKIVGLIYPIIISAGAVAGVVAVNTLTYGVGTLPTWIGIPTSAPLIAPAAAAASRIYVITSGVLGAWVADALYNSVQ